MCNLSTCPYFWSISVKCQSMSITPTVNGIFSSRSGPSARDTISPYIYSSGSTSCRVHTLEGSGCTSQLIIIFQAAQIVGTVSSNTNPLRQCLLLSIQPSSVSSMEPISEITAQPSMETDRPGVESRHLPDQVAEWFPSGYVRYRRNAMWTHR